MSVRYGLLVKMNARKPRNQKRSTVIPAIAHLCCFSYVPVGCRFRELPAVLHAGVSSRSALPAVNLGLQAPLVASKHWTQTDSADKPGRTMQHLQARHQATWLTKQCTPKAWGNPKLGKTKQMGQAKWVIQSPIEHNVSASSFARRMFVLNTYVYAVLDSPAGVGHQLQQDGLWLLTLAADQPYLRLINSTASNKCNYNFTIGPML